MEMRLARAGIRRQLFFVLSWLFLSGCQIQGGGQQAGNTTPINCIGPAANLSLLQPWQSISGFIRVMPLPFAATARPSLPPRINLQLPVAVAASPGTIYIADAGHQAIFRFERAADSIALFAALPGMNFSTRLFLDEDLSLYVLDQANAEILQFDAMGRLVQRLGNTAELPQPVAVIVSPGRREIVVADAIRGHLLNFDPLGGVVGVLGSRPGSGLHFDQIVSMARGPEGIYLVDKLQHRVHQLGPGKHVTFGAEALVSPGQIAVDDYGRVFVADQADSILKVFQAGKEIQAFNPSDAAATQFLQINGLWADSGFLYVADAQRASIEIFQIAPPCQ